MVTPRLYYGAKEEWIDTHNIPTYGLEHEVKVAGKVIEIADDIFTIASLCTGGVLTVAKMGVKKATTVAFKKLTSSTAKVLSNERGAIELGAVIGGKGLGKAVIKEVAELGENKINHILQGKHDWGKVVSDANDWSQVSKVMSEVMEHGVEGTYKGVFSKTLEINGEIVEVTYAKLSNGIIKISDAWVRTK